MHWPRNTGWRQGSVISSKNDLGVLFSGETFDSEYIAIVISHDCDIANDKDKYPYVEFVFCKFIVPFWEKNPALLARRFN